MIQKLKRAVLVSLGLFSGATFAEVATVANTQAILKAMKSSPGFRTNFVAELKAKHPQIYRLVKDLGKKKSLLESVDKISHIEDFKIVKTTEKSYGNDNRSETSYCFVLEPKVVRHVCKIPYRKDMTDREVWKTCKAVSDQHEEGEYFAVAVDKIVDTKLNTKLGLFEVRKIYKVEVEYVKGKSVAWKFSDGPEKNGGTKFDDTEGLRTQAVQMIYFPTIYTDAGPDELSAAYYDQVAKYYLRFRNSEYGFMGTKLRERANTHVQKLMQNALQMHEQSGRGQAFKKKMIAEAIAARDAVLSPAQVEAWKKVAELGKSLSEIRDESVGAPEKGSKSYVAMGVRSIEEFRGARPTSKPRGPGFQRYYFHGCRMHQYYCHLPIPNSQCDADEGFDLLEDFSKGERRKDGPYFWIGSDGEKPVTRIFQYKNEKERDEKFAIFQELDELCSSYTAKELELLRNVDRWSPEGEVSLRVGAAEPRWEKVLPDAYVEKARQASAAIVDNFLSPYPSSVRIRHRGEYLHSIYRGLTNIRGEERANPTDLFVDTIFYN